MHILPLTLSLLLVAACGSKSPSPAPQTPAPSEPATADRPSITAAECEAQGGQVIGDIGDGAVHRADYVCDGGAPPVGKIANAPDGPVAVEGAVCCKKP